MAIKYHNPKSVSLSGKYSLGAEVPANARYLYVSGQVGVDSRGKLQQGFDKQAVQVWKNIGQVLKAGGMGYKDIVKITSFLTDARFVVPNRAARDQFINEPYPAWTAIGVTELITEGTLVEIRAIAKRG